MPLIGASPMGLAWRTSVSGFNTVLTHDLWRPYAAAYDIGCL